jgi:dihydrolipoamide dehydrogenase
MDYDIIIIGAGWAGFNAAITAKESGLKAAIIERGQVGGTCLNRGCIPTKALIQSAKVYSLTKKSKVFGVEIAEPKINFSEVQARKDKILQQLRVGIEFKLKGVDIIQAEAKILSGNSVSIGQKQLSAKAIIVATGSKPVELRDIKFDGKKIISSDDMLNLKEAPKSLLIIGGGVIGCEFAGLFSALGTQVSIAEKMPQLLPGVDKDAARKLETVFKKKGIKINTNIDATTLDFNTYDLVLLCVGRTPNTGNLGLEEAGVTLERGRIKVDEYLRTGIPSIYAAGDCTGKVMLAHFAAYQGIIAAQNIASPDALKKCDNAVVPNCIFTDPEIASVGIDEVEAAHRGLQAKVHKFDFLGSGMARILEETDGFIKIVSDAASGLVLGGSIVGPRATELIGILTLAVSNGMSVSQIRDTIFAHPTLSESIHETLK